ncbi:MAG: hypothetical protein WEB56_10195, partial [Roseovarius sp.]
MTFRNGYDALRRFEDPVLFLIDDQPYQLANLNSHDPHMVVKNSTTLAQVFSSFDKGCKSAIAMLGISVVLALPAFADTVSDTGQQ